MGTITATAGTIIATAKNINNNDKSKCGDNNINNNSKSGNDNPNIATIITTMGFIKIRMDITSNFCSQSHGIDPYNQQSTHTLFFQTLLAKMIEWTQWNPNEISTYLGVTSKMNGRQEDQLIEFLQRVSELDRQLCINNISPQYGHQYQQWSITPTLSYSLTASSLSDEQIERIHKIIHQNIVAYKGFIRHWPC